MVHGFKDVGHGSWVWAGFLGYEAGSGRVSSVRGRFKDAAEMKDKKFPEMGP